jgi:hypothetical protein
MANSSSLPIGVVVACLCAAPAYGGGTIYTCLGQNGAQVLQDMPCDANSEVVVQKDAGEANTAGGTGRAAAPASGADAASSQAAATERPDARNAKSDAPAAASDPAASDDVANLPSEPAVGMTQQQVRAILGEPTGITQEEVVQGKQVTWTYGDSRVLQFDTSGLLSKK